MTETKPPAPPQISPYVFPVLLAGFGLWCFYDGWISVDPDMMKHQTFNRIASGVLLLWAGRKISSLGQIRARPYRARTAGKD